ncbi:MAG: PAS domain-containing protein, partial [Gammaproteobacteria bacterium]|nr:PAS domain-containing protein [Gammaproteobacteria bacterium]
ANVAAHQLLGIAARRLDGTRIHDFIKEDSSKLKQHLRLWTRSQEVSPVSLHLQRADGSVVECQCGGALIRPGSDDESALILLRCWQKQDQGDNSEALNDHFDNHQKENNERKRLEAKLHKIETWFAETQRLVRFGSWDLDIATQQAVWSEQEYRILGYEPYSVESSSENLLSRIHPDDLAYAMQELERPFQEKNREYRAEFRIVRPDKQVRTVAERGRVIYDEQGKARRYVGATLDITERKQAEQERERLIEELEAKNADLERFVYTISHELKSPLVTISGFAGLLGNDVKERDSDKVEHDIQQIIASVDTMSALLEDLLELSRYGHVAGSAEKISLHELARDVANYVSAQIAGRHVEIKILPDLPVIYGDRTRLREVLQNLVENAIKFMGDQSEPQVEIGSRDDGAEVVCYVRDNGAGIDPAYQERVFGLFERLDPKTEGTGVGLALVRRIVELPGGRIWIESEGLGKGSTFLFTIPRTE